MSQPWNPLRRGGVFCSPACGFKCTVNAHDRARREGEALAASLGPGWTPRVWENCGWQYEVRSGAIKVRPNLGLSGSTIRGDWKVKGYNCQFENTGFYANGKTPKAAIQRAGLMVRERVNELEKCIEREEAALAWLRGAKSPRRPMAPQ